MNSYGQYRQQDNENTPLFNTQENYNQPRDNSQWRYGVTSTNYSREINFPREETVPTQTDSQWLYQLGTAGIALSVLLLLWCLGLIFYNVDFNFSSVYVNISGSIFHVILGIVAVYGSKDHVRHRNHVIACFLMSLFSLCVILIAMVTIDVYQWATTHSDCNGCDSFGEECPTKCSLNFPLIFAPMIAIAVFQYAVVVFLYRMSINILGWYPKLSGYWVYASGPVIY